MAENPQRAGKLMPALPDKQSLLRFSPSVIALVLANLIPLSGVLFWNWSIIDLFTVFWAENVIIGIIILIKFLSLVFLRGMVSAIFTAAFFIFHYGLFCFAHIAITFAIFGDGSHFKNASFNSDDLLFLAGLFIPGGLLFFPALSLFISHFFSYLVNFIGRQEYLKTKPDTLMAQPYGRIVVLHVAILCGGFIAQSLGAPVAALVVLIALKIAMDLSLHIGEHKAYLDKESA
jgi:hypothetical protein